VPGSELACILMLSHISESTRCTTARRDGGRYRRHADMHMAGDDMVSMYYVDGDQLLMTRFCPTNNQPRMKAVISADLNTVTFDFLDATNLPSPQAGHMHRAIFLFSADPGHYSEEWTWKQEGKDTKMYFEMQRKK